MIQFEFIALPTNMIVLYLFTERHLKMASSAARILVTGASAGIGLCLAKRLATQGYKVFGCANQNIQAIKVFHITSVLMFDTFHPC